MTGITAHPVDLDEVLSNVLDQVLEAFGLQGTGYQLNFGPTQPRPNQPICATVRYTGTWHGALKLVCDRDSARALAARMTQREAAALDDDDVSDALAEVANILGGNIKPMLPGINHLGLPTVREHTGSTSAAREDIVATASLQWGDLHYLITVVHDPRQGADQ